MLVRFTAYVAYTRKALVNLLGMLAALLSLGLLPAPIKVYVTSAFGILTVVLHYWTPNADAPASVVAIEGPTDPADIPDDWKPAEIVTATHAKPELTKE